MKKIFLLFYTAAFILAACKSKKVVKSTTASTSTVPGTEVATVPMGPVATEPSETMVNAGKTKFSDLTLDELKKGQSIYNGPCTGCHEAKRITKWDEKEWVGILNEMSFKAKLGPAEKDAVWKYIMSVKLASK